MGNDKMREDFEAWYAIYESRRACNGWIPLEKYLVTRLFDAWKASRETLVIKLPTEQPGYMYYAPDVVEAIEAAGLKVKP
ncbi:hypothetical protein [Pseudomonas sp. 11/12A]|uniref:hypothetical protein n=1 Tax=Pseudomonas sp. 11/12A TaxID=1506582 RepID=UPI000645AAB7|nr:hypothetical protein [Pseudomonas sp. 11/12A]